MSQPDTINQQGYKKLIVALSIVIPVAVALLFKVKIPGVDLTFLPPIYASINGLTALALVLAIREIKNGRKESHEKLIKVALGLSASFLIMYVLYHMTSDATPYGGEGTAKYIYYFILISHIILSIGVIPLVLFTFLRGISMQYEQHKKIAKYAFPLWLYVAVSGVIVYLMISPYYG